MVVGRRYWLQCIWRRWQVWGTCATKKDGDRRSAQMGDFTHPSAGEERAGRVAWAIQKVISVQLQTEIPRIGQAEITTAHRQACESDRDQMHKGQIGRQRGKGKGRAKWGQCTNQPEQNAGITKLKSQANRKENRSQKRKIRLVCHICELTKEEKNQGWN